MAAESLTLSTADGIDLEAELHVPDTAAMAVLACHPHPLRGGSMHDGVPDLLFRALPRLGMAVLRFNFRGVGRSRGVHDNGKGEQLDVASAIDRLAQAAPSVPLIVVGWSFGADVSLAVTSPAIAGWAPIAPPLRVLPGAAFQAVARDPRPKLLLCPELDQFNPADQARAAVAEWVNTEVLSVPGADHFLWGHDQFLIDALVGFAARFAS